MPAYKDTNGTYFVSFYYEDFRGVKKRKMKRGFARRRDALDWERRFLLQSTADLSMKFSDFVEIYRNDKQMRIRESTWESKNNMIDLKILPYFKDRPINAIEPKDIIAWQNEIMNRKKTKRRAVLDHLSQIHPQSAQRDFQPRGSLLPPAKESRRDRRQHGQGFTQGNAVLDKGRVSEIRQSGDGQADFL